ncbi:MAG: hypothetical protein IH830_14335, partial [Planctomycetes bacterium]|nr:hypothetical protein [Planctomycetota bacterium]
MASLMFVERSTQLREELKLEFTKNLSDALELIAEAGRRLGFSREDMQYVHYKDLLKLRNPEKPSADDARAYLDRLIQKRKTDRAIYDRIPLPPVICSEDDFLVIRHGTSRPNFITNGRVQAELVTVDSPTELAKVIFHGRIALIQSADPGYDFLFAQEIVGLITQYGGAASHMAIRCAELGIPAAIGVG